MTVNTKKALKIHEKNKGKIEIKSKVRLETRDDLSIAYTPGVAEPCRKIHQNKEDVYKYTIKGNTIAIITDGSAVLGLGNIGPEAALPVMEGKALLFKKFANIDAFPICLKTQNTEEIIKTIKLLELTFGGINLEDISAPRCFEIEEALKKELNIPVFHDDQHGTAIVVLAALYNSLKLKNQKLEESEILISGAGAAGIAIANLLISAGAKHLTILDSKGTICTERKDLNTYKKHLSKKAKIEKCENLENAIKNKDIFVGVSKPNILTTEMIKSMNPKPIIFAMANPDPEIKPELAKKAGAFIIGTGRSDYPNQINNAIAFPGLFRALLDYKIKKVTTEIKIKTAMAIANTVKPEELNPENIIPDIFNKNIIKNIKSYLASFRTNI